MQTIKSLAIALTVYILIKFFLLVSTDTLTLIFSDDAPAIKAWLPVVFVSLTLLRWPPAMPKEVTNPLTFIYKRFQWLISYEGRREAKEFAKYYDAEMEAHRQRKEAARDKSGDFAKHEEIINALGSDIYPALLNVGAGYGWGGHGNILTVGGARGGKGVNLILPALLDIRLQDQNAPSFVVLDPKGENCAVSAPYLKSIGYKVHVINPFEILEVKQFGQARISPFDMFNVYSKDFGKYLDMIAFSLIPDTAKADQTWDNAGRKLIKFYIAHMMTASNEPKTFTTLYNWIHYAGKKRDELLTQMTKNEALGGIVAAGAWSIIGHLGDDAGKMVAGMYESAQAALSVFDSEQLRYTVSGSDFDLKTLTANRTAVFVCVNPSDLRRVQSWMRIIFNTILDGLPQFYSPNRKVVILMDEFPTIGRLQAFENNFAFLPGYNVTLWPIVQDLNQLKKLYPDMWETFVGQAHIKHWLAIGDNFTAEYISARMPRIKDNRNPNENSGQLKPMMEAFEIRNFAHILAEIKDFPRFVMMGKIPYWKQNNNGATNPFR